MTKVLLALLSVVIGLWHICILVGLWWLLQRAIRENISQGEKWFCALMLLVGGAWTALLFSGMARVQP